MVSVLCAALMYELMAKLTAGNTGNITTGDLGEVSSPNDNSEAKSIVGAADSTGVISPSAAMRRFLWAKAIEEAPNGSTVKGTEYTKPLPFKN